MYCEKCGVKLEEEAKFCLKCGAPVAPAGPESFQTLSKPKRKRSKAPIIIAIVVGVVPIFGILASIFLVSLGGAREAARDAAREADMHIIVVAQEMYYGDNGVYYTSIGYPSIIGDYLTEAPRDPGNNTYIWVNNTGDPQKFCVYVALEKKKGYYTASHNGNFECSDTIPTLDNCCFHY